MKILAALLTLATASFAADPIIGNVTVSPNVIPANTATPVKITAFITDPAFIAGGANVQRLDASGNAVSVVGVMREESAGVYAITFSPNEPTGRVNFRVSAAFRGLAQRVFSSSVAVDFGGSSAPLGITARVTPAANAAGWHNADATVTYACTGGAGGLLTCPAIVRVSTDGRAQAITGTARDGANNTAVATSTISLDKTAPVFGAISPAASASPVFALTGPVADATSGLSAVTCNGQPANLTPQGFSCNVNLAVGLNAIALRATDQAGNAAQATANVTFAPQQLTITSTATPAPNANGWNNTNVTVSFACAGGGAPLNCQAPQTITTEGGAINVGGTVRDAANNQATTSRTLKIDKTPPILNLASPASTLTTPLLALTGTATDALSGIATVRCNNAPATLGGVNLACNVNLVAGLNTISIQATDQAGNTTTATQNVTLNATPLRISAVVTPTPNAAGWNRTDATVNFTCAGGVAPVTCPPPSIVTTEGANQTISGTARDAAGNGASAGVTVKLDKTPPVINVTPPLNPAQAQITLTGTIADALSGIATVACNGTPAAAALNCPITLVPGLNNIPIVATDQAGNSATTNLAITFAGATGLTITTTITPAPNAAGWHNTPPTVTFTCNGGTAPLNCPAPRTINTDTANQAVTGTVTDAANRTATASVTIKLDQTPPALVIDSPANNSTVNTAAQTITGSVLDALSGIATVTCNGAPESTTGGTFTCPVTLTLGANTISLAATDIAGNTTTSTINLQYGRLPQITFTAPANLAYLNLGPTTVTGTVTDADPGTTLVINGLATPLINNQFSAQIPLAEGPNILTATATTPTGATSTASITVTLDTTPPHVTFTSPPDGFVTSDTTITAAGNINDIVVGTVNSEQAQVTVNGAPAQVANRTFLATNVPLNLGANTIQAVGRDRSGNAATTQITVIRQTPQLSRIETISGNNQTAIIGAAVAAPLVVRVTDSTGAPSANKPVIFKVIQNNGMVNAAASAIVNTNAQGQAQALWTLGLRSGAGGNTVEAYCVGASGTAVFNATGTQGTPGKIVVDSGDAQIAALNQRLPQPLIAVVVDQGNNRLAGVPVTFSVKQGGGSFASQPSVTVNSDSDGRVAALLTLGGQEGNSNNLVEANFPGNTGYPAAFTASGRAVGDPARTTITGVVLDNSNVPIPGVAIRAVLTNLLNSNSNTVSAAAAVTTDAQGQFTIASAPVGYVKLLVDGSTATRVGRYPSLDYDFVTIAGQKNVLGMPIYLLPINTANQLCVTPTTGGGTLTIPDAPGFSLTFAPGQVTFPGGSKTGCVSVTVVHSDKVPMVPGFGQQPRFIVTIQPAGAVFNPPAPITIPNVDGLAPRAVTEMYSFDHDIGSFVAIGTGRVSEDGQTIASAAGVGVLKAGWHCGGNPGAIGTAADCPICQWCQDERGGGRSGGSCVADSRQTGDSCFDRSNTCFVGATCSNGSCVGGTAVSGRCVSGGVQLGDCIGGVCVGLGDQCPASCNLGRCVNGQCVTAECTGLPDGAICSSGNGTGRCRLGQCIGTGGSCPGPCPYGSCVNGVCASERCEGQRSGTFCIAGGRLPGVCAQGKCEGRDDQCSSLCDGGTCTDGKCNWRLEIQGIETPSGQVLTSAVSPQNGSFVAPADLIVVKAKVVGYRNGDANITWSVTPTLEGTPVVPASPADSAVLSSSTGPELRFRPRSRLLSTLDPSGVRRWDEPYNDGRGNALRQYPHPPLAYRVEASVTIDGFQQRVTLTAPAERPVQDAVDALRQEYIDFDSRYSFPFSPGRVNIRPPSIAQFNRGNYTNPSLVFEQTPGNLDFLLSSIQSNFSRLLFTDVQVRSVGSQCPSSDPNCIIVFRGRDITTSGRCTPTTGIYRVENCPDGADLGVTLEAGFYTFPEGDDVCMNPLGSRDECLGPIRAGTNGRADTEANNRRRYLAPPDLSAAVTSAFRNPQRNFDVGSTARPHTTGRALDFGKSRLSFPGLSSQLLMCMLESAAESVAGVSGDSSYAEIGPITFVKCNNSSADHIHVNNQ